MEILFPNDLDTVNNPCHSIGRGEEHPITDGILQLQHGYGRNLTTPAWLRTESYYSSLVTDGILLLQLGYGQNLTTLAWLWTESYYSSLVTDGILLLQLGYRRNLTTLNGTNKYYVFHNMVQHLNGFEFKYSRIFLHQLSIMYFTIW